MRGKRIPVSVEIIPRGLIPAYAGKTLKIWLQLSKPGAHPRVCGENRRSRNRRSERAGSSPRMRGKPSKGGGDHIHIGLIPAYAGKTFLRKTVQGLSWAHPRVCGENRSDRCGRRRESGSSPRMRGKLRDISELDESSGLIPAYAGKTENIRIEAARRGAHPRVCGENGYLLHR